MSQQETHSFQTEVTQLLDLMIHSLYSNKEIFLRELISNASDAADKLRFDAATDDSLFEGDSDLHVFVDVNKEANTITIRDNGIGMSRDEVIEHIGTIAKSGTKQFLQQLSGDEASDAHLIGQFGVGFYSSFLVADKVSLKTRRAGLEASEGVLWSSEGKGEYAIEAIDCPQRGTEITLHLREEASEYLDDFRLRSIVHKYADHIPFPIRMNKVEKGEGEDDAEIITVETVNQAQALWKQSKSELSDEDYQTFYKHVSHDFEDAQTWLHQNLEGKYEYTLLLYVPKRAPFDLWQAESKAGVKLYVNRVFIMEANEDLLPRYLRFVRGVMDSADLPLNVSREILQQSPAMDAMRKGAVKRILSLLSDMAKKQPEDYQAFWNEFGQCIKEGVIDDFSNRERLAKLLRFSSTKHDAQSVSLADYIARMPEGQDTIYYITADSLAAAKHSPHLEVFTKKGVEVLLMHQPVDEWLTSQLHEFDGKKLQSVAKGELDLSAIGDADDAEATKEQDAAAQPIAEKMKAALGDRVKDVRVTHRLTESPACIVSDEFDMSANLERILKQAGQQAPEVKPILEINPEHQMIAALADVDDAQMAEWAGLLLDQAVLAEGALPSDPAGFVRQMNRMLLTLRG